MIACLFWKNVCVGLCVWVCACVCAYVCSLEGECIYVMCVRVSVSEWVCMYVCVPVFWSVTFSWKARVERDRRGERAMETEGEGETDRETETLTTTSNTTSWDPWLRVMCFCLFISPWPVTWFSISVRPWKKNDPWHWLITVIPLNHSLGGSRVGWL